MSEPWIDRIARLRCRMFGHPEHERCSVHDHAGRLVAQWCNRCGEGTP